MDRNSNAFVNSFPKELNADLQKILQILPNKTYNDVDYCSDEMVSYQHNAQKVSFPYRVYFVDISSDVENELTDTQKEILYCIYTRCCDGYVREKYISKLLNAKFDKWAIPYIVKVCDEYVVEILELIYSKLKDRDNKDIQLFCLENKGMTEKSYDRMVSYWNEYYRNTYGAKLNTLKIKDYIGKKLFNEILGLKYKKV